MALGYRKKDYKFTQKKQSKKGIAALILSMISIAVFLYVVFNSFYHAGEGSMYLGSAGVTSMLLALISFILAASSIREEGSFKLFPYLALICSFLTTGIWISVYVIGFLSI